MTAQQKAADNALDAALRSQGFVNEGGVWYTPAQLLNRQAKGSVTPAVVNPANEPPAQPPTVPDVGPLLYPASISAPVPLSAPPPIITGTSNQDYGETKNDGSGETSLAGKDGGSDGSKARRQGYYREPWDNVARRKPRKKGTGKKVRRKKRKK